MIATVAVVKTILSPFAGAFATQMLRDLTGFDDPVELFDALDSNEKGEVGQQRNGDLQAAGFKICPEKGWAISEHDLYIILFFFFKLVVILSCGFISVHPFYVTSILGEHHISPN